MTKAIVFPGQGSQFVGMSKDLHQNYETVRKIFSTVDKLFLDYHGDNAKQSISETCFNGPEELLQNTAYTQPAIIATSISILELLKENSPETLSNVKYFAGHSLGEFAALYAAGVISLEDTFKLIIKRGDLMSKAEKGAMTAVLGLGKDKLSVLINSIDKVSVANFNSPEQIVITGSSEAVAEANQKISDYASENELKVKVIPLSVGGAFHSPLMDNASEKFSELIDQIQFNDAKVPVIQNYAAEANTYAQEIKEVLKKQMTGAVQWTKTVEKLINSEEGIQEILELGPSKVLNGLVKKQNRRFPVKSIQSKDDLTALIPETSKA
ncbi:MAG: ACP S-malonyltransferase [Candidatus Caenarcaniphilales bacterium]|nr:ACP S-malonyltransferase [Candidatus Caenarcaniphilales bacterium]